MRVWVLAISVAIAAVSCTALQNSEVFDPYAILGVTRDATSAAIKKVYRKLSTKYHPDVNKDDPDAANKFAEIAKAYEILSDDAARESFNIGQFHTKWEYDEWRKRHGNKASGRGFYPEGGAVLPLDKRNFVETLTKRTKPVLVMFYADWCVHCQHFAKHYRDVALQLGDDYVVSAINCGEEESVCASEGIPGYPTLRLLHGQGEVETFEAGLDAAEPVVAWARDAVHTKLTRITSEKQFASLAAQQKNEAWLVTFTAGSWCPPCTAVKPMLRQAASKLKGRLHVVTVDCDAAQNLCAAAGVQMYPMLKAYGAGAKTPAGGTTLMLSQYAMHNPAAAALELVAGVLDAVLPKPVVTSEQAHDDL